MGALTFSVVFHTLALWLGYVMLVMLGVLFLGIGVAMWLARYGTMNDGMSDETMAQLMREFEDEQTSD